MSKRRAADDVEEIPRPLTLAKTPRRSESWHKYPGMITRVHMKDFMCHAELNYQPTERLNFLHGANGSGKVRSSTTLSADCRMCNILNREVVGKLTLEGQAVNRNFLIK